jgi:hypothetical protein
LPCAWVWSFAYCPASGGPLYQFTVIPVPWTSPVAVAHGCRQTMQESRLFNAS